MGGTDSPGAGVAGTCETFDVGAGNPTPDVWKNKEAHAISPRAISAAPQSPLPESKTA